MESMALLNTERSTRVYDAQRFGPCRVMSGLLRLSSMHPHNARAGVTEQLGGKVVEGEGICRSSSGSHRGPCAACMPKTHSRSLPPHEGRPTDTLLAPGHPARLARQVWARPGSRIERSGSPQVL